MNKMIYNNNLEDMNISKIVVIYQCMCCSANEHVKCISKMAIMDGRSLINNNLQTYAR